MKLPLSIRLCLAGVAFAVLFCGSTPRLSAQTIAANPDGTVTLSYSGVRPDGVFYREVWIVSGDGSATEVFSLSRPDGTGETISYSLSANGILTTNSVIQSVGPVNQASWVAIVSPTNGSVFATPADISITANAASGTGAVTGVDFYAGMSFLGSSPAAPYSVTWTNAPAGNHLLRAVAGDSSGATIVSSAVSITVNDGGPNLAASATGGGIGKGTAGAADPPHFKGIAVAGGKSGPAVAKIDPRGGAVGRAGHEVHVFVAVAGSGPIP
jgi:hypothetical protein